MKIDFTKSVLLHGITVDIKQQPRHFQLVDQLARLVAERVWLAQQPHHATGRAAQQGELFVDGSLDLVVESLRLSPILGLLLGDHRPGQPQLALGEDAVVGKGLRALSCREWPWLYHVKKL